ncbi:MAG: alpha-amylase family glycosyl hydrolase [Bacteroidetes bacterium]|nr:alpha-amylase family glycosyl hydrolase [Bacteroidota bacterium]
MKRSSDTKRYWVQINGLVPQQPYIYQYLVDGNIRIGDPYAEKVSDPWNDQYISPSTYPGILPYPFDKTQYMATVLQTGQPDYTWQSSGFIPPAKTDMVIYELLVRDFTDDHSFTSLMDTIGYLKKLGINAIELMPVSEFEGNLSWGYNPDFYFAVDKYYGPAFRLQQLIDTCHQLGIAVISDIVLNHSFGSSPYVMLYWDKTLNRPAANSPFYNPIPKHDFNVGYDFNHESPDTKYYISNILKFWLTKYRFDGYRFDLSKGFTQTNTLGNTAAWGAYDASRIAILSGYFDTIIKVKPSACLILEHFADNTEEKELSTKGMLLWGNMNGAYRNSGCGFTGNSLSDLSWGVYTNRQWTKPNLVTYMESHDEERQMFNCIQSGTISGSYNIRDTLTALRRMALNGAFFFTLPGPKMILQFGERGYDYSINWPCMTSACRMDAKPPRWDYLENWQRRYLLFQWAEMIKLKKDNPVFETADFDYDLQNALKKIRLQGDDMSMVVLGNFGVQASSIIPNFYHAGTWYDYFSGDSLTVNSINALIALQPGEFRIYTSKKLATPIGIPDLEPTSPVISIYPNPSDNYVNINVLSNNTKNYTLEIYNTQGQKVDEISGLIINNECIIHYSPGKKGLYVVRMKSEKRVITAKFIIL